MTQDTAAKGAAMPDARRHAPATLRNREPILGVLRQALPATGLVLEIASGTGEHAAAFAAAFPRLAWQPSDPDPRAQLSIAAHAEAAGLANLRQPLPLDAAVEPWPIAAADAVLAINMIHIAPWPAACGLVAGAARILPPHGLLYLYGPFRQGGRHTADSNRRFDDDLRRQDPAWGVRDLEAVTALAAASGFALDACLAMPANNLSVLYRRLARA
jgi:hypothetical protein